MEESESTMTKTNRQQEQERLGLETVVRLQEEFDEEERQRIAHRIQVEEREKYTEVEQARMLIELINQRKNYTLKQLRSYSFDEIKTLFETTMREVKTFVPMESEDDRIVSELAAKSSKRHAEEELVQQSSK
ncbi:hypothetical protein Tco_0073764 [Tanacetum coccineum]